VITIRKKQLFAILLSSAFLIADDLIVDKNSRSQYQTDNFLRFDSFDVNKEEKNFIANPAATPDTIDISSKAIVLGSTFTQEAWIYSDQKGNSTQDIIGYAPTGPKANDISPSVRLIGYGTGIHYGFGDGSTFSSYMAKDVIATPGWYHIAVTFDGTNYILFLNGSQIHTYTGAAGKTPLNTPIKYIGLNLQGSIDEVRMWDVARSESEIKNNMNTRLSGAETNLVAYYPMDINGDYQLIDLSPNQNHGIIKNVNVMQSFSSNECSSPDGTVNCPYPTINSALDDATPGDRVLIKGGRYSEYITRFKLNDVKIEGSPDENVIIDGTIPLNTEWVPYNHNGHNIYKTVIDFDSLSYRYGVRMDSVYTVFVNDRYMMMAMPVNFKNPTDSINGDPRGIDDSSPTSIYKYGVNKGEGITIHSPVTKTFGSETSYDLGYRGGELAFLDTLEEWSFDPGTSTLYLYPSVGFIPDKNNVRIRTKVGLILMQQSDNMEFRNLHIYSGPLSAYDCDYLRVENSKFSFSTDMYADKIRNGSIFGEYSWWINLVFENSNNAPPLFHSRHMYATMENILFTKHSWFSGSHHYVTSARNYRMVGGEMVYGQDTWRYITVMNSNSAGIFGGFRSLLEYIRIENIFDYGDGSGIQRNGSSTDSSTTRYSWVINAPRWNGIRWNSTASGHHADMHHMVSVGNSRGYRLKGDWHDVHHVLANDSKRTDISLPDYKYQGIDKKNPGAVGNANSKIKNSAVDFDFECMALDCMPEKGAFKSPIQLDSSGIYYLRNITSFNNRRRGIEIKENGAPYYNLDVELENPWSTNKAYSDQNLLDIHGVGPIKNKIQNYDFRPKKGSALIDGGIIIEGINDGTDKIFNHRPDFPGQNRKFIGEAPDIGPYEYGDSAYWIPGYRYPHPSVPIPSDGATDISLEYGIAFNYPYKKDYTNVSATVTISGPGVNRIKTFQYPNNVLFETFEPGGTYHWSVTVDGVSSPTWNFTVKDRSYPLNDVSIDTTVIGIKTKDPDSLMVVSNNRLSFMRFDIPNSINNGYKIELNLMPYKKYSMSGGIVLYKYGYKGWNESFNSKNIGFVDKSQLTPIDTVFSITESQLIKLDLTSLIDNNGEYSFALGSLNPDDSVSFYSSEKLLVSTGAPYRWEYPYIPDKSAWPSLSFSKDSLSIAYDIPLEKEWNLISVPFTGVKTRPKQIFRTLIRKGLLEYVSSPKGYFKPGDPYSTLTTISSKEGYYLKLNGPINKIFFRGRALTDKTISLSAGWNMIAYSPDYELAVDKAFESLIASNTLQYVTGFVQGARVYDPDAPQSSTLNTLKPTKGYWVKVNAAVTDFSFPAQTQGGAVGKTVATHSVKHPEVKPNPSFMFVKGKIMGRYNVGDWVKVLSEANLVVGAAIITEGGYLQNSAVYGDDVTTEDIDGLKSGEKIAFVYDGDTLTSHVQFNPMSFHDVSLDYDTFLPTTFALYQNHPNPFNPITTIRYDLPENGPVSIIIYDLMGREIKTLVKQVSAPGRYSVNWNGRNQFGKQIASGMYFYRMETPEFQSVKKLIFLK